ncbi:MAG: AMP-binding protein [Bacteroidales bacterium]|nr:AMP-binding protein [Bacteroidales bacterium]
MSLLDKFLEKTEFSSYEDFLQNYKVRVPDDFNFGYDVVDAYAATEPNKEAILWTNDRGDVKHLTYADYKRLSDMVASYFLQLGIRRGDCVMLILKRRLEWWISMVALHKIGAVAVPATHLLTDKDIIYRCNEASIRAIVAVGDPLVLRNVIRARPYCPSLRQCISVGPSVPQRWENYWQGAIIAPKFYSQKGQNKVTDNFLLYFTSGTSSEPKMVMHDFSLPLGHIITGKYWHNVHDNSLHITVAETGWAKAVWGKIYGQMIAGATQFVYDFEGRFKPLDLLRVVQDFKVTSFCAPPTIYRFMIQEDLSQFDLSHLEWCTTAGEALNPNVFEEWKQKTGIMIYESYGQTESAVILGTYPFIEPRPGSMGKPNGQYDVDVLDDEGRHCPPHKNGHLVIRLPKNGRQLGLLKEYYKYPELTAEAFKDGIYDTNDIVNYDEDGYYWFVGRSDDVIKSSGYRIGPFEVESALMSHPAVLECAITGAPDPIRGTVVKATVVLTDEYKWREPKALIKELQDYVKQETAPYKYPRIIEFVSELPKTISGKIRRVEIRQKDSAEQDSEQK